MKNSYYRYFVVDKLVSSVLFTCMLIYVSDISSYQLTLTLVSLALTIVLAGYKLVYVKCFIKNLWLSD